MATKAAELMQEGCRKARRMPPPSLPVSAALCVSPLINCAKHKRIHLLCVCVCVCVCVRACMRACVCVV